jgi:hypothetical protein
MGVGKEISKTSQVLAQVAVTGSTTSEIVPRVPGKEVAVSVEAVSQSLNYTRVQALSEGNR